MRKAYDAYNREGITGILRYLDPEVEWRNAREYRTQVCSSDMRASSSGRAWWMPASKDKYFEPERIDQLPQGQVLVSVRFRFRGPTSDVQVEVPFVHLMTWRDGKVTKFSMFTGKAEALKAAGLEE